MDNDENERQENSKAEDNDGGQLVHLIQNLNDYRSVSLKYNII